jgi:hypothetical protein
VVSTQSTTRYVALVFFFFFFFWYMNYILKAKLQGIVNDRSQNTCYTTGEMCKMLSGFLWLRIECCQSQVHTHRVCDSVSGLYKTGSTAGKLWGIEFVSYFLRYMEVKLLNVHYIRLSCCDVCIINVHFALHH